MRWLKRDEGVSLVLVAVLILVLISLAGFAVDAGALFAERRELRNGADAAALAIAEDCGRGTKPCDDSTAGATALLYADENSRDRESAVDSVDLVLGQNNTGSVRVVTSAWDAQDGVAGVRTPLMGLLGFDRVTVRAAATAIFDHPSTGRGLPLVIERYCMDQMGQDNSGFVLLHTDSAKPGAVGSCQQTSPAGQDAPGAFGWIDIDTSLPQDPLLGDCLASFGINSWDTFADPGAGAGQPPKECEAATLKSAIYQKTVMIAVYSQVRKQGNNTEYWVDGFAAFFVEGYRLGSSHGGTFFEKPPSGFWDNQVCPQNTMCLYGHFTEMTVYTGDTGGPDNGVVLVKLTE